ncbi:calcium-binding and coiled-coil domain-containing protein 2-like [Hylaeus volcanicus]|uniref:calcium-binding and coiled-coil domain-containing protein 2-like n=1 Tax=Hylaeus volcanicus TaxID=313075 RepID=UPI0023B829A6|nr:calcium-binding and coiled-coil domain-containing protein 2-like [Hylaeus volcanicus]
MKMYCCARGTFHCQYANGVQFEKLKTKYSIDEDIIVEYTLHDKVSTSSRDWVGIFPRGWTNLQQYLTFEYVLVAPKMSSLSRRSIMFLHTFHREASLNIDYHFVYISKEIEIMGTSSYFRFTMNPKHRFLDRNANSPEVSSSSSVAATSKRSTTRCKLNGCAPSIGSLPPNYTEKFIAPIKTPKMFDDVIRPHRSFSDHRQRTCRFHCTTKLAPTITSNRIQFLMSHNEQLGARVGRLLRDLELTETAVKREKMARMVLTNRLQTYETFVAEMFRSLNVIGVVKITDKAGNQIIAQKIKPNELSSMNDEQVDKCISIPEISMLNQSIENMGWNHDETMEKMNIEEVPRGMSSLINESLKNKETISHDPRADRSFPKREHTPRPDTKHLNVILSGEQQLPWPEKFSEVTSSMVEMASSPGSQRGCYVTKEATGATNEADDNACRDNCKIEESNRVEGKAKETKNSAVDEKDIVGSLDSLESMNSRECSGTCHHNCSVKSTTNKQFDKEWALVCQCDFEVTNGVRRLTDKSMANLKHYLETHATNDVPMNTTLSTNLEGGSENPIDFETLRPKPSAILIKGRDAKFSIIRY